MSRRCENLLLQIYLQFPEVIQHVRLPDASLSGEAAADGSTCKVLTGTSAENRCWNPS